MLRLSNNLIGILNFLTFLLSVPILWAGIWLHRRGITECEKFLDTPLIVLGVFLLLVSLAGLVGACFRNSLLLWIYLVVMFLLILVLLFFTVFAFVVTNKGAGEVLSGKGYKEYRLGDYSHWLQKRVNSTKNWSKIKSCLMDGKSGCCKPSNDCNFAYVSPTNWTATTTSYTNTDCKLWSNDPSVLCFSCQSCKAGLLDNIKHDWKKVAVINIIFLVVLVIVYSIGCCAFRNNREDNFMWKGP
ncbi:hypothetical protein C3L33_03814, partial [Rhododendron williamsianum]